MSEGGEIPGRRKSRKVILTSLVLNEQRKPTVFLQRVKDLKVIQFQKIDQNRIGYDEVTNKPMIPINSHSNVFFISSHLRVSIMIVGLCFSSTCLNYIWGLRSSVSLIERNPIQLRDSHRLRFHLLITISTNDFQGF